MFKLRSICLVLVLISPLFADKTSCLFIEKLSNDASKDYIKTLYSDKTSPILVLENKYIYRCLNCNSSAKIKGYYNLNEIDGSSNRALLDGTSDKSEIDGTSDESEIDGTSDESEIDGTYDESEVDGTYDESEVDGTSDKAKLAGKGNQALINGNTITVGCILRDDGSFKVLNARKLRIKFYE